MTLRPDAVFINVDGIIKFNPVRVDPFPIETETCECIPENQMVHYQKSDRQILYELKNMVLDLV